MLIRLFLIVGFLLLATSNLLAQSATVGSTSIFCETENSTPDKYVEWGGTWSGVDEDEYVVVGCYAPVYGPWSPATYYSPGPAITQSGTPPVWGVEPAPAIDPGGSSGAESVIVPMSGPDGGTLEGVYVWFEYGIWDYVNGRYYWKQEGVLCSWVWVGNPGGGCFAAGTMVLTPSGYKPIESLRVGDSVISARRDSSGASRTAQHIRRVSQHSDSLIDVTANGQTIRTTRNHPFLTRSKGWVTAAALRIGDELLSDTNSWSAVETIYRGSGSSKSSVYNLEIDGESSYFVGGTDWGVSFCVADSCSVPKSLTEQLASAAGQEPRSVGSKTLQDILRERFTATKEPR